MIFLNPRNKSHNSVAVLLTILLIKEGNFESIFPTAQSPEEDIKFYEAFKETFDLEDDDEIRRWLDEHLYLFNIENLKFYTPQVRGIKPQQHG